VKSPKASSPRTRTIDRACDVLFAFKGERELLRLRELARRTGLDDATTLRIVRTLVARGMLERADSQHYRSRVRILTDSRYTIGYAAQCTEFAFSREVTTSITWAAERQGINLVCLDNRYSRAAAIRNAESLIKRGVDLALEFQTDEKAAPIISSLYEQAGIPVIAIEIPHPGATFFGADNYKAGLIGGRHLGHAAQEHWAGEGEEILMLELSKAGPLPASRLTGILDGVCETAPKLKQMRIVRLNGNGQFGRSQEVVRKHLRQTRARRILVGAINDPSALGALRAFEEAGRSNDCLVAGQNASLEARAEMRRPGTRLIGSVAYFPERYGPQLIQLALNILDQRQTPPAIFVNHQLVTPQNVNIVYPNDPLLSAKRIDSLMLQATNYAPS
jgi:ribose transport system substrate-binding protein